MGFFQAAMKAEPCKCHLEIPRLCSALALLTTVTFSTRGGAGNAFFFFSYLLCLLNNEFVLNELRGFLLPAIRLHWAV